MISTWTEIGKRHFDVIHLDAEHTEKAVALDLVKCMEYLRVGGVLIVDDIRHPYFPGVAFSIHNFIEENKLTMLVLSEFKAYLCREEDYFEIQKRILESIKT